MARTSDDDVLMSAINATIGLDPSSPGDVDLHQQPHGPPPPLLKQSLPMVVVFVVAYTVVFVVGVVGNTLVVYVICRYPSMRSVTNFFIVNLAVADVLVCLFCLPFTLVSNIFTGRLIRNLLRTKYYHFITVCCYVITVGKTSFSFV